MTTPLRTDAAKMFRRPTLFRWLLTAEWRAHPGRSLLSMAAIAIGVALGFAVHLINAAALGEFSAASHAVSGDADVQVRAAVASGPEGGFDEKLYGELAAREEVAVASPVLEAIVLVDERAASTSRVAGVRKDRESRSLKLFGIDPLRAIAVTPGLIGHPAADDAHKEVPDADEDRTRAIFDPDAVFLSPAALIAFHKEPGDSIVVRSGTKTLALRIAGTLPAAAGERIGAIDIAALQWRLDRIGRLSRIDLKLAEGVDEASFRSSIAAMLPSGAQLATRADDESRIGLLSRAYRVNLDMLAMMALFTGGFLVYSTQSLSIARRRPQLALLRVIGITRTGIIGQMMSEGVLLGIAGGVAGLALGVLAAALALRFFGGDLGGGYFAGTHPELRALPGAAPLAAAVFFALGLAAALAGSFVPAREAARAEPAVALKASGEAPNVRASKPHAALAMLAAGCACALLPPVRGLPVFGYLSIALLLFGGVALMPWLLRAMLRPRAARSQRSRSAPRVGDRNAHHGKHAGGNLLAFELAAAHLRGAPRQASVALSGIVAAASLAVAMAVMIASFRQSVDDWLSRIVPADLYVRIASMGEGASGAGFGPAEQAAIAAVPGVASVAFGKSIALTLAADRPPVALIVRGTPTGGSVSPDADLSDSLPLVSPSIDVPTGSIPIWVSEAMVDLYRYAPGKRVVLPLGSTAATFFVAGVWRDYARQHGAIVMRDTDYLRLTGDATRTDAGIVVDPAFDPTVDSSKLIDRIRRALPPALAERAAFIEQRDIRARTLAIFDRSFALTYVLQAIAVAIGLAGVAATFSAQTLARAKELGMLRHIGVLRRQIVAMLACEGALLGAIGVAAGLVLGFAMSQVLIRVVNPQSFHWTIETHMPWLRLAGIAVALALAAAATAVVAGRRALSGDAVRAVREDW